MRALSAFRIGRRSWYVLPWLAVKSFAISLVVIAAAIFALDRLVLPGLERQGLTAGEDWARHNGTVVSEHQLADRTFPFPEPTPQPVPAGVRSWIGHPVTIPKQPGTKRILVMGDSFVWGSPYLSLNHMWWRQLGQILADRSVEVIAIGRPGAATHDQLHWARHFVPIYEPDLIIWGYVTNDADEGLVRQIGSSQQSIPKLDRVRNMARQVWPRVMAKFDALRSDKLAKMFTGPEYGYEYAEWELKLVEPDNLAAYSKTVAAVKDLLDETQIPGFMMTLPNFPSTENFTPRTAPILKVWRDMGIPAHDTTPEFVRRYGETPRSGPEVIRWGINPADGHPGPRTCRFLAEQAAEIVGRDFPQILGPRKNLPSFATVNDWLPTAASKARHEGEGWTMSYPGNAARFPTMPLGVPTAMIAFEQPLRLAALKLEGASLKSAQVWVSCLEPTESYDDGILHDLGERNGPDIVWKLPAELVARPVSVIQFRATFSATNSEITWSFTAPPMQDP